MKSIKDLTKVAITKMTSGDEKGRASSRDYKAAGDALREIWDQFKYGEKGPWLEENWLPQWSESKAYKTMDVSKYWYYMLQLNNGEEPLGWNDAQRLIDELRPNKKKLELINPAKLVKSKLAKSISNSITDLDRDALLFLCDHPDAIDYFVTQMRTELEPLAVVMSGWSLSGGFVDDEDYSEDELREQMTERIITEFQDAQLTAYQEQAIREYFENEYDEETADNWRTMFQEVV